MKKTKKHTSRLIFKHSLIFLFSILLKTQIFSQNVSYNANSIPINTGNFNSAFGFQTLFSNTTGYANVTNGYKALYSNTTGYGNIGIGFQSLLTNSSGNNNTSVGWEAMKDNTTGPNNTAIGNLSLSKNTSGSSNVALGMAALQFNTTGSSNTACGYAANSSNVIGNNNTSCGFYALINNIANNGTAFGAYALRYSTTGINNTGIGIQALQNNTTGSYNTALGYNAGPVSGSGAFTNATAIGNGAIVYASNTMQFGDGSVTKIYGGTGTTATFVSGGLQITGGVLGAGKVLTSDAAGVATWQALPAAGGSWAILGNASTIDGTNFIGTTDNVPLNFRVNNSKAGRIDLLSNTFYGIAAGNANTTGTYNTANSALALYYNTTGSYNTAYGYYSLMFNTTGYDNTGLGTGALAGNTTGNNNTSLGNYSDVSTGNLTNATAVGFGAITNASNKIRFGNGSVSIVEGPVAYSFPSDGRFKTDVSEKDVKGIEFIKLLRPVVYNFDTKKYEEFMIKHLPDSIRKKHMNKDFASSTAVRQSGFIAQEVEKSAKEVGYNFNGVHAPANDNDHYSIAYSQFVVPLVKAVQEQQQMIEAQQQQIDELRNILASQAGATERKLSNSNENTNPVNDITVFPNPSKGVFTVISSYIENGTIDVYTLTGNRIYQTNLKTGITSYKVDISTSPKGIYLMTIRVNGKEITTKKIVIE